MAAAIEVFRGCAKKEGFGSLPSDDDNHSPCIYASQMINSHPTSFACAIVAIDQVKPSFLTRIFSQKTTSDTGLKTAEKLAAHGLKIVEQRREPIRMFSDFEEEYQLTRVPVDDQFEIWLGSPLAYIMNDFLRLEEPSPTMPSQELDALFIRQDENYDRYEHQYVCGGKLGEGLFTCGSTKRSWSRTYRREHWPPPENRFLKLGLPQLHAELDADNALIQRVYSGMYGKGRYGMAYHPTKKSWVMARSLPDEPNDLASASFEMFQELNPNSYAKKGKPIAVSEDPKSGCAFLRQTDVIYEVQQRAIAAALGFRLDKPILNQDIFRGEFDKYWVERSINNLE